jgi:8-oxo-dGTP pyrophosphatase MutT (NUDIX family)
LTQPIQRPVSRQPIPQDAKHVFRGKLFDVYQWQQTLFNGHVATFEKLRRLDTAYVIPVRDDGSIVILEQRQPGSARYVGLIGGRVEPSESAEEAAGRELGEEAGLKAPALMLWRSFQFLPKIDWAIYVFIARDCTPSADYLQDGGEEISLMNVSPEELFSLAAREEFGDVEIALLLLRTKEDPSKKNEFLSLLKGGAPR